MNINDRNFIHKCTSCQICASVCPKEAISINLNLDGFYRPYIDKDKCVNCGICKKFVISLRMCRNIQLMMQNIMLLMH